MNAKKMIAAIAVLSATTSAFAVGSEEVEKYTEFQSTKTRAEVRAELERSIADGSYAIAHQEYEGQLFSYSLPTRMARSKVKEDLARGANAVNGTSSN